MASTLHEKWDFRQYAALLIVVELQVSGSLRQFAGFAENSRKLSEIDVDFLRQCSPHASPPWNSRGGFNM